MAEVKMGTLRPNIRIEILNNLTENEAMEVDENLKSDNEEGEIVDDEILQNKVVVSKSNLAVTNRGWPNTKGIFTTGINIFDKQEQEKLQERAKRFALKPEEIHNFTDADLEELHESLGITSENETNIRFEAVHMIGTKQMSTEDVLEYFAKYAPTSIEWIDDDSCNVLWLENISAARAIFYISKVVRGMPARGPCDPFIKEFLDNEEPEIEGSGQSILLKNKNREVELKVDDEVLPSKVNYKNSVDMLEITIPIPPGYWRLGEKCPKAKCLLLRFAFKTDKKPYKTEKFSKYYKKYGNPNHGTLKGVISESKKKEIRGIFERNKELNQDKNPWGSLAKNWDHDVKFREREPESVIEPKVEIKNPSILVRLGAKRKSDGPDEKEPVEDVDGEDSDKRERKKNKLPRMRMYADEEEEKLRRKKLLQTIKKQAEKLSKEDSLNKRDLRNVLGITNKRTVIEEIIEIDPEVVDLGTKLKNRTKNMIFTVEREIEDIEVHDRKENVRSDIRSLIEERRARTPVVRRRISPPRWTPERRRSPMHRTRSPVRRHRSPLRRSPPRRRKSPERTLHSDRMYPRHRHRRRRTSDYSEDEMYSQKPKSKVAVVIRAPKKPTVASTIWSRVQRESESESSTESEEESSWSEDSSSTSEESESDDSEDDSSSSLRHMKRIERPGFRRTNRRLAEKVDHRSPLKITMTNDHFKK